MIARLLARFRRRTVPAPSHPSVGLIRTERNTDPIDECPICDAKPHPSGECQCDPCTTPAYGHPAHDHCAACCGGTGIAVYAHDCPRSDHAELARLQHPRSGCPTCSRSVVFGVRAAHEVLADDERKAARRAWADDTLQRALSEGGDA